MSRHDDAISSLMNEWSQQQGYNNNDHHQTMDDDNNDSSNKTHRRRRLLEELEGYPNNSFLAGNSLIWNPYIQGPNMNIITNNNDNGIVISTNPDVEVIRRRCFESFKEECIQSIQRILLSYKKLSIPSILEKWHMDAKHQERQQYKMYRSNMNNNNHKTTSYPIMASTFEINAWTRQQQDDLEQQYYYYDPVLLSKQSANLLTPYLKEELIRASWNQQEQPINNNNNKNKNPPNKTMNKKLNQIQKAMVHAIQTARESYRIQLQQASHQEAIRNNNNNTKKNKKKLPKIVQHDNGDDDNNNLVCVIHAGIKFKIHPAYYEKLQRLFDRQQQQQRRSSSSMIISFQEALFCMLCRYDMIQGSGLQASIPGSVMDVLLQQFNLNCSTMECFASPLNCRYEMYGSAFVELDVLFGSRFNFFDLDRNLPSGCYQANPPFCEGIIGALHIQLQKLLSNADHDDHYPLMFIVFVPAWNDSKSYQQLLLKNEFLTHHFILKAGKHWYAEGTQHRRQGSFRLASFDTSILLYQNDAAKIKWPIKNILEDALKDAFCQNPGSMNKTITTTTTTKPPSVLVPRSTSQKQTNDDDNMKQQPPKTSVDGIVQQQQQVQNEKLATIIPQEDINGGRASSSSSSTKRKKNKRGVHGGGGGRKKRIFINHEEEKTAQLNVLASLGLTNSSSTTAVNDDDDNNAEDTTTIRQTILPSLGGGGEGNDEKVASFESNNKSKRKRKKKKLVS